MRLWSLHPSLLDRVGLVACWREGLLARAVLTGKTVGYRNHPQLTRFRRSPNPVVFLDEYLHGVCNEADRRGYRFDRSKLGPFTISGYAYVKVTDGQLAYEFDHLQRKRAIRSEPLPVGTAPTPHPLFWVVPGGIEEWERV